MSWTNSDGLTIYFGHEEASLALDGAYADYITGEEVYEFRLDLTTVTTSAAAIPNVRGFLPALSRPVRVELQTEVVATGGTSFSIGMFNKTTNAAEGTAGAGLVAAAIQAVASVQGETTIITPDVTYAGDALGIDISGTGANVYFTALQVGDFATGVLRVKVYFQRILATA